MQPQKMRNGIQLANRFVVVCAYEFTHIELARVKECT